MEWKVGKVRVLLLILQAGIILKASAYQFNEKVESRIDDEIRTGVRAVNLVHDEDNFVAHFNGLFEDESCLRFGTCKETS